MRVLRAATLVPIMPLALFNLGGLEWGCCGVLLMAACAGILFAAFSLGRRSAAQQSKRD